MSSETTTSPGKRRGFGSPVCAGGNRPGTENHFLRNTRKRAKRSRQISPSIVYIHARLHERLAFRGNQLTANGFPASLPTRPSPWQNRIFVAQFTVLFLFAYGKKMLVTSAPWTVGVYVCAPAFNHTSRFMFYTGNTPFMNHQCYESLQLANGTSLFFHCGTRYNLSVITYVIFFFQAGAISIGGTLFKRISLTERRRMAPTS